MSAADPTPASDATDALDHAPFSIVAIETATETVGVAVRTADGVEAEFSLTGRRRHVEALTPALAHLLDQVGLAPGDLDVVAVDLGPGLFTGLRVGVAAAKGLAEACGIGVIGATSLDILVRAAARAGAGTPGAKGGLVLACVDARRGEVFAALHELDGSGGAGSARLGPALFAPDALADALGDALAGRHDAPVPAVGDGALRYASHLGAVPGLAVVASPAFPPPGALLELARARIAAGERPVDPARVVPLYLREADATSNFARAART